MKVELILTGLTDRGIEALQNFLQAEALINTIQKLEITKEEK